MEPTKKQIANGCRHFTGLQNKRCEVGVEYGTLFKTFSDGLPCLRGNDGRLSGTCPLFKYASVEEIEVEETRINEALNKMTNALASGKCPECGESVEPRRQVGRCVYSACGHRLFQGKL